MARSYTKIIESHLLTDMFSQFRLLVHFAIYLLTTGLNYSIYTAIDDNVVFKMNYTSMSEQPLISKNDYSVKANLWSFPSANQTLTAE